MGGGAYPDQGGEAAGGGLVLLLGRLRVLRKTKKEKLNE